MDDALGRFFGAWGETDPDVRHQMIETAMAADFSYADPRSDNQIKDLTALVDYVGQFSANAQGWGATVIKTDTVGGFSRSLVGFGDADGVKQHGQYFSKTDGEGRIRRLIGFAGLGGPE